MRGLPRRRDLRFGAAVVVVVVDVAVLVDSVAVVVVALVASFANTSVVCVSVDAARGDVNFGARAGFGAAAAAVVVVDAALGVVCLALDGRGDVIVGLTADARGDVSVVNVDDDSAAVSGVGSSGTRAAATVDAAAGVGIDVGGVGIDGTADTDAGTGVIVVVGVGITAGVVGVGSNVATSSSGSAMLSRARTAGDVSTRTRLDLSTSCSSDLRSPRSVEMPRHSSPPNPSSTMAYSSAAAPVAKTRMRLPCTVRSSSCRAEKSMVTSQTRAYGTARMSDSVMHLIDVAS